jgi:hypothetical protein
MNNKFDELTKSLAQSVTRRAALKKFGIGLVAAVATSLGIRSGLADPKGKGNGHCVVLVDLVSGQRWYTGLCVDATTCQRGTSDLCSGKVSKQGIVQNSCDSLSWIDPGKSCSI